MTALLRFCDSLKNAEPRKAYSVCAVFALTLLANSQDCDYLIAVI